MLQKKATTNTGIKRPQEGAFGISLISVEMLLRYGMNSRSG
jgi:hypothetical protein